MNNRICLISFYNPSSLGLNYLERALRHAGYDVTLIFLKAFNSINPKPASAEELNHLCSLIKKCDPVAIGFSVMASLYLDVVHQVNKLVKEAFPIPIIWGGVYASMFPEKAMNYADFVIRGEGEEPLVELLDMLNTVNVEFSQIQNLTYRDGEIIHTNPLRKLTADLDKYGPPVLGGGNKYVIENGTLTCIDPKINSHSYETSCSRGCPFACSYCCTINLKRIYAGNGQYVRFRSVEKVMEELIIAKQKNRKLKFIRFWDEIFSNDAVWIDAFVELYKKKINLPFEIWCHPLKCDDAIIAKLKIAGLYKVVMGIQSGSPYIRKEVFNRPETQDAIIAASKVLAKNKVPQVVYDFMLRHPFETKETLKETYELCKMLALPFELQLHGLNFLPGTDIVAKAQSQNLVCADAMKKLMYAPMQKQFNTYWKNETGNHEMNYIYKLIYLTQFPSYRKKLDKMADDFNSKDGRAKIDKLYKTGTYHAKLRYLHKRGLLVAHSYINRFIRRD